MGIVKKVITRTLWIIGLLIVMSISRAIALLV